MVEVQGEGQGHEEVLEDVEDGAVRLRQVERIGVGHALAVPRHAVGRHRHEEEVLARGAAEGRLEGMEEGERDVTDHDLVELHSVTSMPAAATRWYRVAKPGVVRGRVVRRRGGARGRRPCGAAAGAVPRPLPGRRPRSKGHRPRSRSSPRPSPQHAARGKARSRVEDVAGLLVPARGRDREVEHDERRPRRAGAFRDRARRRSAARRRRRCCFPPGPRGRSAHQPPAAPGAPGRRRTPSRCRPRSRAAWSSSRMRRVASSRWTLPAPTRASSSCRSASLSARRGPPTPPVARTSGSTVGSKAPPEAAATSRAARTTSNSSAGTSRRPRCSAA